MAKNIAADQHIPMAFFSLEMTDVQLANRLMSNTCMIEGQKLLSGQMDREDWKRLDKYLPALTDAPLYIDDTEGLSVMELRSKARRLKKEHDIQLIMVETRLATTRHDIIFIARLVKIWKYSKHFVILYPK